MALAFYQVLTTNPLTVNVPDMTGTLPSRLVKAKGDVFIGDTTDANTAALVTAGFLQLLVTSTTSFFTANTLKVGMDIEECAVAMLTYINSH